MLKNTAKKRKIIVEDDTKEGRRARACVCVCVCVCV